MKLSQTILSTLLVLVTLTTSSQNAITKKYNHKIVFSKSEIIPGKENEAAFITEYKPGDALYYRVYMDSTIKQIIAKWRYSSSPADKFKHLYVKLFIDGTYTIGYTLDLTQLSDEQLMGTAAFGSVMYGATATDAFRLDDKFKEFMGTYADKLNGRHELKMEIYMYDKYSVYELYGSGVITINSEGGNVAANAAGIKNEFHQKHLGKIVFGNKPLGPELSANDIVTDYTVGQPLYYRIFMDNTMKNYITKIYKSTYALSYFNHVFVKFYLDGQYMKMDIMHSQGSIDFGDEEKTTLTTYGGAMMVDKPGQSDKESLVNTFEEALYKYNKAFSGTHKLKMEVYLYAQGLNQTVALLGEGEVTLHLTAVNHNHPELCFKPTAAVSDPDLEAKLVKAYNDYNKGAFAKKAWLKFANWDVNKNELTGAILGKYRNAELLIETGEGNCSYQEVSFGMDYEGNGKYGYIHFSGLVPGGYRPILCECLK